MEKVWNVVHWEEILIPNFQYIFIKLSWRRATARNLLKWVMENGFQGMEKSWKKYGIWSTKICTDPDPEIMK